MMNTPGAHRERTPRPAARCNTLDFHGKSCALAEGLELASSAAVYTIRCSCKQWPCIYMAPCAARTCWEESQTHIAAQLWQRRSTHPARTLMHAANAPRRGDYAQISSITPPQQHRQENAQHTTYTAQIQTPSRPRWKLCSTPTAPHDQAHRQQPRRAA